MDKNQRPMADENVELNKNVENNGENYTFVEERIVTKKRRFMRFVIKVLTNLIIPICLCLLVVHIYVSSVGRGDDGDKQEDDATSTYNGIQIDNGESESSTQNEEDAVGNEQLVKLEEIINQVTVVVSVVRRETIIVEKPTESETTGEKETTTGSEESSTEEGKTSEEEETTTGEEPETEIVETTTKYTGVVIAANGAVYILMPAANVAGYEEIYCQLGGSSMVPTTVYNIDSTTGLVLLKVAASRITPEMSENIKVATFEGSNDVSEGEEVVYYGSVVGNSPMFLMGHISNNNNIISCPDMNYSLLITDIMYDNVVDGFIFNNRGNLVGIAGMDYGELELPNMVAGAKAIDLKYIINNMLNDRKNIYFGIVGLDVSPEIEEMAGTTMPKGIYVKSVIIDSPAYNAGIMAGDIIYVMGTDQNMTMAKFRKHIEKMEKGDSVAVRVKRRIGTVYNIHSLLIYLETAE